MIRAILLGSSFFLACNPKTSTPKALPYPVAETSCVICKMSFYEYPIADTLTYQGKLLGFCSEACKKTFLSQHHSSQ